MEIEPLHIEPFGLDTLSMRVVEDLQSTADWNLYLFIETSVNSALVAKPGTLVTSNAILFDKKLLENFSHEVKNLRDIVKNISVVAQEILLKIEALVDIPGFLER